MRKFKFTLEIMAALKVVAKCKKLVIDPMSYKIEIK